MAGKQSGDGAVRPRVDASSARLTYVYLIFQYRSLLL
jgi:hypothetical protein